MNSTDDGRDLKSISGSAQKGKAYFIELYKSLESRLSSKASGGERVRVLCEAWQRTPLLCQHSVPATQAHLVAWIQTHTARALLQAEWQSPESSEHHVALNATLEEVVRATREAASVQGGQPWQAQLVGIAERFVQMVPDPWGHPVLRMLLNTEGEQPDDEQLLKWLSEEKGAILVARLRQLATAKCQDLALALATEVMDRARASIHNTGNDKDTTAERGGTPRKEGDFSSYLSREAGFTLDVWNSLTDIELVLLHKSGKINRCKALANQIPLRSGCQLVDRLCGRLDAAPNEKRLWKNAKDVAKMAAGVIIQRCMKEPWSPGLMPAALNYCVRVLVRLSATGRPDDYAAHIKEARTAHHLYTFTSGVEALCTEATRPFVCELFIHTITYGMNELQALKDKTEKECEARAMEQTLSKWFVEMGEVMKGSNRIYSECLLTAFSVHPSNAMYEKLVKAPAPPRVQTANEQPKEDKPSSEFGSWANDSATHTNFVKTSQTLNMKQAATRQANVLSAALFSEGESLGLSPELCNDLASVLGGSRVKTLSWDMDRVKLLENCRLYMERTGGGTKSLVTELKYLNLDPSSVQHLPEEVDEEENDAFYGIEKGYEHLLEFQDEPKDVYQDHMNYLYLSEDETTESAYSSSYSDEFPRKAHKKSIICSDNDSDPLSLHADIKKKERLLAKERRPKRRPKEKPTQKSHSKERSRDRRKESLKKEITLLKNKNEDELELKKENKSKQDIETKIEHSKCSLSSMVGMKVCATDESKSTEVKKKVCKKKERRRQDTEQRRISKKSHKDITNSQGKSSLTSMVPSNKETTHLEVVADGLYSKDGLHTPSKYATPLNQTITNSVVSSHEPSLSKGSLSINDNLNSTDKPLNITEPETKNTLISTTTDVCNNTNTGQTLIDIKATNTTISKEVKRKLIEFRKNKIATKLDVAHGSKVIDPYNALSNSGNTTNLKEQPKTPLFANSNATQNYMLTGNKNNERNIYTSTYIAKCNPHLQVTKYALTNTNTMERSSTPIQGSADYNIGATINQYSITKSYPLKTAEKDEGDNTYVVISQCGNTCSNKQANSLKSTQDQTDVSIQTSPLQTNRSKDQQAKSTCREMHNIPNPKNIQNFVKELAQTINAGTSTVRKRAKPKGKLHTVQHEMSHGTYNCINTGTLLSNSVNSPNFVKSSQCAKVSQKKVENVPNTFARLSYMHKNKQEEINKTKQLLVDGSLPVATSNYPLDELNQQSAHQKLQKYKYMQTHCQTQMHKTDKTTSSKSSSSLTQLISAPTPNSVANKYIDALNSNSNIKFNTNCLTTAKDVRLAQSLKIVRPSQSTLSETNQMEFKRLLWQQSKLNANLIQQQKLNNDNSGITGPAASNSSVQHYVEHNAIVTNPLYKTLINQNRQSAIVQNITQKPVSECLDQSTKKSLHPISIVSLPTNLSAPVQVSNNHSLNQSNIQHSNKSHIEENIKNLCINKRCSNTKNATKQTNVNNIEIQQQDWESVLNELLSHQTPSRGENALDLKLKKDHAREISKGNFSTSALLNQRVVNLNTNNLMSSKKKTECIKTTQKTKKVIRTNSVSKIQSNLNNQNRTKPVDVTTASSTDYALLDEEIDKDLLREIDELTSDEEDYPDTRCKINYPNNKVTNDTKMYSKKSEGEIGKPVQTRANFSSLFKEAMADSQQVKQNMNQGKPLSKDSYTRPASILKSSKALQCASSTIESTVSLPYHSKLPVDIHKQNNFIEKEKAKLIFNDKLKTDLSSKVKTKGSPKINILSSIKLSSQDVQKLCKTTHIAKNVDINSTSKIRNETNLQLIRLVVPNDSKIVVEKQIATSQPEMNLQKPYFISHIQIPVSSNVSVTDSRFKPTNANETRDVQCSTGTLRRIVDDKTIVTNSSEIESSMKNVPVCNSLVLRNKSNFLDKIMQNNFNIDPVIVKDMSSISVVPSVRYKTDMSVAVQSELKIHEQNVICTTDSNRNQNSGSFSTFNNDEVRNYERLQNKRFLIINRPIKNTCDFPPIALKYEQIKIKKVGLNLGENIVVDIGSQLKLSAVTAVKDNVKTKEDIIDHDENKTLLNKSSSITVEQIHSVDRLNDSNVDQSNEIRIINSETKLKLRQTLKPSNKFSKSKGKSSKSNIRKAKVRYKVVKNSSLVDNANSSNNQTKVSTNSRRISLRLLKRKRVKLNHDSLNIIQGPGGKEEKEILFNDADQKMDTSIVDNNHDVNELPEIILPNRDKGNFEQEKAITLLNETQQKDQIVTVNGGINSKDEFEQEFPEIILSKEKIQIRSDRTVDDNITDREAEPNVDIQFIDVNKGLGSNIAIEKIAKTKEDKIKSNTDLEKVLSRPKSMNLPTNVPAHIEKSNTNSDERDVKLVSTVTTNKNAKPLVLNSPVPSFDTKFTDKENDCIIIEDDVVNSKENNGLKTSYKLNSPGTLTVDNKAKSITRKCIGASNITNGNNSDSITDPLQVNDTTTSNINCTTLILPGGRAYKAIVTEKSSFDIKTVLANPTLMEMINNQITKNKQYTLNIKRDSNGCFTLVNNNPETVHSTNNVRNNDINKPSKDIETIDLLSDDEDGSMCDFFTTEHGTYKVSPLKECILKLHQNKFNQKCCVRIEKQNNYDMKCGYSTKDAAISMNNSKCTSYIENSSLEMVDLTLPSDEDDTTGIICDINEESKNREPKTSGCYILNNPTSPLNCTTRNDNSGTVVPETDEISLIENNDSDFNQKVITDENVEINEVNVSSMVNLDSLTNAHNDTEIKNALVPEPERSKIITCDETNNLKEFEIKNCSVKIVKCDNLVRKIINAHHITKDCYIKLFRCDVYAHNLKIYTGSANETNESNSINNNLFNQETNDDFDAEDLISYSVIPTSQEKFRSIKLIETSMPSHNPINNYGRTSPVMEIFEMFVAYGSNVNQAFHINTMKPKLVSAAKNIYCLQRPKCCAEWCVTKATNSVISKNIESYYDTFGTPKPKETLKRKYGSQNKTDILQTSAPSLLLIVLNFLNKCNDLNRLDIVTKKWLHFKNDSKINRLKRKSDLNLYGYKNKVLKRSQMTHSKDNNMKIMQSKPVTDSFNTPSQANLTRNTEICLLPCDENKSTELTSFCESVNDEPVRKYNKSDIHMHLKNDELYLNSFAKDNISQDKKKDCNIRNVITKEDHEVRCIDVSHCASSSRSPPLVECYQDNNESPQLQHENLLYTFKSVANICDQEKDDINYLNNEHNNKVADIEYETNKSNTIDSNVGDLDCPNPHNAYYFAKHADNFGSVQQLLDDGNTKLSINIPESFNEEVICDYNEIYYKSDNLTNAKLQNMQQALHCNKNIRPTVSNSNIIQDYEIENHSEIEENKQYPIDLDNYVNLDATTSKSDGINYSVIEGNVDIKQYHGDLLQSHNDKPVASAAAYHNNSNSSHIINDSQIENSIQCNIDTQQSHNDERVESSTLSSHIINDSEKENDINLDQIKHCCMEVQPSHHENIESTAQSPHIINDSEIESYLNLEQNIHDYVKVQESQNDKYVESAASSSHIINDSEIENDINLDQIEHCCVEVQPSHDENIESTAQSPSIINDSEIESYLNLEQNKHDYVKVQESQNDEYVESAASSSHIINDSEIENDINLDQIEHCCVEVQPSHDENIESTAQSPSIINDSEMESYINLEQNKHDYVKVQESQNDEYVELAASSSHIINDSEIENDINLDQIKHCCVEVQPSHDENIESTAQSLHIINDSEIESYINLEQNIHDYVKVQESQNDKYVESAASSSHIITDSEIDNDINLDQIKHCCVEVQPSHDENIESTAQSPSIINDSEMESYINLEQNKHDYVKVQESQNDEYVELAASSSHIINDSEIENDINLDQIKHCCVEVQPSHDENIESTAQSPHIINDSEIESYINLEQNIHDYVKVQESQNDKYVESAASSSHIINDSEIENDIDIIQNNNINVCATELNSDVIRNPEIENNNTKPVNLDNRNAVAVSESNLPVMRQLNLDQDCGNDINKESALLLRGIEYSVPSVGKCYFFVPVGDSEEQMDKQGGSNISNSENNLQIINQDVPVTDINENVGLNVSCESDSLFCSEADKTGNSSILKSDDSVQIVYSDEIDNFVSNEVIINVDNENDSLEICAEETIKCDSNVLFSENSCQVKNENIPVNYAVDTVDLNSINQNHDINNSLLSVGIEIQTSIKIEESCSTTILKVKESTINANNIDQECNTVPINSYESPSPEMKYNTDLLKLTCPARTYSGRGLKRKHEMKQNKAKAKKFRKGKNIDFPKLSIRSIQSTSYNDQFKRLVNYYSSLKFSYCQSIDKSYCEIEDIEVKSWPFTCKSNPNNDVSIISDEFGSTLFTDIEQDKKDHNTYVSLTDEISVDNLETEIPSFNSNENTINMGFGEESGRVIINSKIVEHVSKLSAATLSDVKHTQPFPTSGNYENDKNSNNIIRDSTKEHHIDTNFINLRNKVKNFFENNKLYVSKVNSAHEYTRKISPMNLCRILSNIPGLYGTEFIRPAHNEQVVQVVQVGQLPVSAAAQNAVSCDSRVSQATDTSPSQCSVENSPHSGINDTTHTTVSKSNEYTELITADLSMPAVIRDIEDNEGMHLVPQSSDAAIDHSLQSNLQESSDKDEGSKETLQNHTSENNSNEIVDASQTVQINNIDYQYENNNTTSSTLTSEPSVQMIYSSAQHTIADTFIQQKQENGSIEKNNQIANAMNAAGIATTNTNTRAHALVNILSQKIIRPATPSTAQTATNSYAKSTSINAMAIQQALAQILPPPLNQTSTGDNNQSTAQVLHIVQGKSASGNQITLLDNSQPSVISSSNTTQVLHIVQNKCATSGATSNGSQAAPSNSFGGISLVDAGLPQGGNQLLHIVNTGHNQKNNAGQLLKRVNLLTNISNVQSGNEQKMVQFVCKSADGKAIQLNAPHQRSMVLRLQPIETPNTQTSIPKPAEAQADSPTNTMVNSIISKDAIASQQEIKSRSVYEENYAKFIQTSTKQSVVLSEKSTSLPKFNQAFGKPVFQDGVMTKHNEISGNNSHMPVVNNTPEGAECPPESGINLDHIGQISSPPLLLRKSPAQTSQPQPNLVQQIKQTIAPMNIQTMHGGVIYTRQIPVNIGGGQTINLITVPSTELIDDSPQKPPADIKFVTQGDLEQSIIKIVPQTQTSSTDVNSEDNGQHGSVNNDTVTTHQQQPVLTQMRIKLPMLSKTPQGVPGTRVMRPSFFQIQRNVIGGANQPVYQQLVLTAAPPLGQQAMRLPQPQTARHIKVPSDSQAESQLSSSTLEQLREFDMVLEQVKERSTVQPGGGANTFTKLHTNTSSDTTDSVVSSAVVTAEPQQQVLYSIGGTQALNVAYVNRKPTITSSTTVGYVRSPDSSSVVDSPSPQIVQSVPDSPVETQQKSTKVGSKSVKSRPSKPASTPPNSMKVAPVPPKTSAQKPLEDEQTTQRILYILAEYKEQVENSPDKDKPAPRRRSNPPSNPSGSSKRKKSSSGSRRPGGRDSSPVTSEDPGRTMGSEDSSCGTSQGDCTESCSADTHSPQDSPRKVARKLTFEPEPAPATPAPAPAPQPRPQPQRNVIVADGQTIAVTRGAPGKPATAVLMPANYILPVSMMKGGQQIAIVTNRGPKLLAVGQGDGGANALLLQRLIGPAGLKPMLARPGVRHVRLPTAALHNLHAFNLTAAAPSHPLESTVSPAPAPTPPDLVESRTAAESWQEQPSNPKRAATAAASPEGADAWRLPPGDVHDYTYDDPPVHHRGDNGDRTVLILKPQDSLPDRYSPDMEAQRIFDKMFDVGDAKKSYIVDGHDAVSSPRVGHAYDIDAAHDHCHDKAYQQVVTKKDGCGVHSIGGISAGGTLARVSHASAAALRHKYAMLEHELRLQKSLSEECEDLGVDSPSASELFPEAELLFATSPAHDHAHDHAHNAHTSQSTMLGHCVVPQSDLDDQLATDHLLPEGSPRDAKPQLAEPPAPHHLEAELELGDVGVVAVGGALDHEEFARSHPNTTFHSEPTDDADVQQFSISALKGRHITSTIFHAHSSAAATVLMTAPAPGPVPPAVDAAPVKYADIDNVISSMGGAHHDMGGLTSVLVKDDGLARFDNMLGDSRELHLGGGTHTVLQAPAAAAQVIRRVCYDDEKPPAGRYLLDEPDALIAGDDAKISVAEDSSRDATLESMGGDADDDRSSPERHAELFWESNSASERSESRRPLDSSSDSDKCCKSPSLDETNSTDSSGLGRIRLDTVIKEARRRRRSGSGDGSSADDAGHPPVRTYPPKRAYPPPEPHPERSVSGKTRAGEHTPHAPAVRRRASNRGVVKRGCHCCNGEPAAPGPSAAPAKKPRQRKPPADD